MLFDVALHLGQVAIDRWPHLHWKMLTRPKSDIAYQWHVVVGFRNAPYADYYLETSRLLEMYGHLIFKRYMEDDRFVQILRSAGQAA